MSKKTKKQNLLLPKMDKMKWKNMKIRQGKDSWWSRNDNDLARQKDAEIFAENMNRGASLLFQDSLILFLQLIQVFHKCFTLNIF